MGAVGLSHGHKPCLVTWSDGWAKISLVPRPNPLTRKGSGVTSLNPWACGSVEALQLLV